MGWGFQHLLALDVIDLIAYLTGEGNGNPLQYSCLGNPRDWSLVGCRLWGHTELEMTEVT